CCSNRDISVYGHLTCGDGSTGSPSARWPCLSDAPNAGHYCDGHGRGMSQWGTKRWADEGQTWVWIVNHYYNGDGSPADLRSAYLTSPLKIVDASVSSTSVIQGQAFQINVSADNAAGL